MSLDAFLNQKPLYYDKIDYDRFPKIWAKYKSHFHLPKLIHIIGTNGKGSTGRFLAHYLFKLGMKVGHYSSPHILKFNERIWLNGSNVYDEILEKHHKKLQKLLNSEDIDALSYFEYTTLLAMSIYQECDFIVLEAGLGGEYDATAVFENDLTLVTPIGIDHESFLGNTLEQIAKTKLKAIRKFAILGTQNIKVYKLAKEFSRKRGIEFFRYGHFFTKDETAKARRVIRNLNLPEFFTQNLLLALSAVKFFGYEVKLKRFEDLKLFGRIQKITSNITIDVGHNPLAAKVIAQAFKGKKVVLVYNSYADKDYQEILSILSPIIKRVEILPIYGQRVENQQILENTIESLQLPYSVFKATKEEEEYLVFGSFSVVEEFLKHHVKGHIT